jgi:hypothetical protein
MPLASKVFKPLVHGGRWVALCLGCSLGTACVNVRIEAGADEVRVVRNFGAIKIELAQPRQAVTGTISGVGLVAAPLGWSLGYTFQRWAVLGDGCRAVVWVDAPPLDAQTLRDADRAAQACLLTTESTLPSQSFSKEYSP